MTIEAFQTLSNGTLVDYALDPVTGRITIRAGKGHRPTWRPIVLEMTTAEMLTAIDNMLALHKKADMAAPHDCGEWALGGICRICGRDLL